MDPNKYTEKLREALGQAQSLALTNHNQAVDVEHLLSALLDDEGGIASAVLTIAGVDRRTVRDKVAQAIARIPKVTGSGTDASQIYVTQRLGRMMAAAELEAEKLKDDYVSVEHAIIAMLADSGEAAKILKEAGLTQAKLLDALKEE